MLADLRVRVYRRLELAAPAGLPVFRRGDLVARVVDDVDSLQDVVLRVLQPFAVAALVGAGTVAALWWFLPQAGLVLLIALVVSATVVPWLTGRRPPGATHSSRRPGASSRHRWSTWWKERPSSWPWAPPRNNWPPSTRATGGWAPWPGAVPPPRVSDWP